MDVEPWFRDNVRSHWWAHGHADVHSHFGSHGYPYAHGHAFWWLTKSGAETMWVEGLVPDTDVILNVPSRPNQVLMGWPYPTTAGTPVNSGGLDGLGFLASGAQDGVDAAVADSLSLLAPVFLEKETVHDDQRNAHRNGAVSDIKGGPGPGLIIGKDKVDDVTE